jgi:hypothetical protein
VTDRVNFVDAGRINIQRMNKQFVFAALYNRARPLGLGFLEFVPGDITPEEAGKIMGERILYFDYVKGRVMKVDLTKDDFCPYLYDRDNGEGAAAEAVASAREAWYQSL